MLATAVNRANFKPEIDTNRPNITETRARTLAQIEDLSRKLHDAEINDSLSSFEGIEEKPKIKKEKKYLGLNLDILGYSLASILHSVAAANRIARVLPKWLGDFIDNNTQYLSKFINSCVFLSKSYHSQKANRSFDAVGRALNPLAVWFAPQEDMYLASGFSSGSTMINFSQKHLNSKTYSPKSGKENLQDHWQAYIQKWQELIKDGFVGKNSKLTLDRNKNQGHLMFIGGNLNFLGAALGMTFGRTSHYLRSISSVIRNTGSVVSDIAKMIDEDANFVYAGILYGLVSVFDVWQAFVNNKEGSRTLSHITQALNNFANYFYTKPSDKAVNKGLPSKNIFEKFLFSAPQPALG